MSRDPRLFLRDIKDSIRKVEAYEVLRGHPPDFHVKYRLLPSAEGGREATYQHLRCDFMYAGDDPLKDGIYMIHPEFLDEVGQPIPDGVAVPLEGRASMWILIPELRASVHRTRARVGVKGHFMEGSRVIGDAVIEELVGLHENSTS